jgi:hypothetical protein
MSENGSYSTNKAQTNVPEHPDYHRNVNWGGGFCRRYNEKFNRDFCLGMRKNTDGEKYFIEFSFVVPRDKGEHMAWATPLDPNQENEKFIDGFRYLYYQYLIMQRKWSDKSKYHQQFLQFTPK